MKIGFQIKFKGNNAIIFFGLFLLCLLDTLLLYILYLVSIGFILSLRLGANVMAGHMLLALLSGLTYTIMTSGFIFFILASFFGPLSVFYYFIFSYWICYCVYTSLCVCSFNLFLTQLYVGTLRTYIFLSLCYYHKPLKKI